MVSKKQRRRALAQAGEQRRAVRLAARESRRRRLRIALTTLAVLVAVTGLVLWIITHQPDGGTTAGTVVDNSTSGSVPSPNEVSR